MGGETLSIQELRLRFPGLAAEEARAVAGEAVRRIAGGLPGRAGRRELGALVLRVMLPRGTPRDRLASLIAEAILGRLA